MSQHASSWIADLLHRHGLKRPDGRPLYAYRCKAEEFDALSEVLTRSSPCGSMIANWSVRAFVLYAAEWWQRKYDGGHWAWDPLLKSIGWRIHYPDLYESVRAALRWWEVDLVRLPTSIRYLGTFACQGGLPLGLVGDVDSRVAQYMRAVLKHTAEYRQFVDDTIHLARDQEHLLRPPTLRRDYVFRLAADLIESVLDLQSALDHQGEAQDKDPIGTLDRVRPNWRHTMPLPLESERARDLLRGLLREAEQVAPPADDFRVERFLRRTAAGWRLGARIRLPASISAEHIAHHLNVSVVDLPPRLQVRVHGNRVRNVAVYAARSDDFLLTSLDGKSQTEIWDSEAAGEVRLQFLFRDVVGEGLVPYRGSALGELPWAFRGDADECPFIGEGSVSNRAPEIVVLTSDGCTVNRVGSLGDRWKGECEGSDSITGEDIWVLDRLLRRISEPTVFEGSHGRCVVRPSSAQAAEDYYWLKGMRCYDFDSAVPLFRGGAQLHLTKADMGRALPAHEVSWRQIGRDWQATPDRSGLWEVRHMRGGETLHLSRAGILPGGFRLSLESGSDMSEGYLVLRGAESVRVSSHGADAEVTPQASGDEVRIHVRAREPSLPPASVRLGLHWGGPAEVAVQATFPGLGGRFLRGGEPSEGELAVNDLYGVRATGMSPDDSRRFWIEGELKASDLDTSLLRAAHFRLPLRKSGVTHEFPLIDSLPMIQLLLASSRSNDANVALRIVDEFQHAHGSVRVSRFKTALEYDPGMGSVVGPPTLDGEQVDAFEALPIARPGAEPVLIYVTEVKDCRRHAMLPQELELTEPWLIGLHQDNPGCVQPIVLGGRTEPGDAVAGSGVAAPRLSEALSLADQDSRERALAAAMGAMLDAEDTHGVEEEWSFLTDSLLRATGLPATELDLLKVLVTKSELLVRCMFRLESAPRQLLWALDDELPFSWLLIQREVWWTEARRACDRLRDQLAGVPSGEEMARGHVCGILAEGAAQLSALKTVSTDVTRRLGGDELSDPYIAMVEAVRQQRDEATPAQIRLRASLDDWPVGDGRWEWVEELEEGQLLKESCIWQRDSEHRTRQPVFDTPVAAAWCCFHSRPTDRTTLLVKRMRAHDPEWFDLAYEAAWFQLALMQDKASR